MANDNSNRLRVGQGTGGGVMLSRPGEDGSPRGRLAQEARVCFATSAGCVTVGSLSWLASYALELDTSLPSLAVVGGIYGIMGLGRWWSLARLRAGRAVPMESGH